MGVRPVKFIEEVCVCVCVLLHPCHMLWFFDCSFWILFD